MRFTFTAEMNPGFDVENLAVNFTAPTWAAARDWAETFMRQIGYRHGKEIETWEIVYARKITLEIDREHQNPSLGSSLEIKGN